MKTRKIISTLFYVMAILTALIAVGIPAVHTIQNLAFTQTQVFFETWPMILVGAGFSGWFCYVGSRVE